MIVYYTGTGNSGYAAKKIAEITGDSLLCMNERIRSLDTSGIDVSGALVIVTPTYAWRIPRIAEKWLEETPAAGAEGAWFVMTCGDSIGNADGYNRALCERKGIRYMGTMLTVMPENYIALFNAPEKEEAEAIIRRADPVLEKAAALIAEGREFPQTKISLKDRFLSSTVNPYFYRFTVKADSFYAKDSCTGCSLCEKLCPLGNISLRDGKPVWGKECTHCMACICHCPAEAIEYGKASVGKPRYHID